MSSNDGTKPIAVATADGNQLEVSSVDGSVVIALPDDSTRSSVGVPKYWPQAKTLPAIKELIPVGLVGRGYSEDEFRSRYIDRLDGIGAMQVVAALERVAEAQGARPLALVCFEDVAAGEWCHRRMAAEWLADPRRGGIHIPELTWTGPGGRPTVQLSLSDDGESFAFRLPAQNAKPGPSGPLPEGSHDE